MVIIYLYITLYGEKFSPDILTKEIDISFSLKHNYYDINPKTNQIYDFGSATIDHPKTYGIYYDEVYENWFIDNIEQYYQKYKEYGVTDIDIMYNIIFNEQCNIEIFNQSKLKVLTKYNISIPLSCYKYSLKKIKELLLKTGYTKEQLKIFK
jgi:hypothetical protein